MNSTTEPIDIYIVLGDKSGWIQKHIPDIFKVVICYQKD